MWALLMLQLETWALAGTWLVRTWWRRWGHALLHYAKEGFCCCKELFLICCSENEITKALHMVSSAPPSPPMTPGGYMGRQSRGERRGRSVPGTPGRAVSGRATPRRGQRSYDVTDELKRALDAQFATDQLIGFPDRSDL